MPPWDNKFIGHSNLVNKTLQKVIEDENNSNKDRQQPKFD